MIDLKPGDIIEWCDPEPVVGGSFYRKLLVLKDLRLLVLSHDDPRVVGSTEEYRTPDEFFNNSSWRINPEQH